MHEYITNLLPRLKTLNRNLNQVEIFGDKEWIFVDGDSNDAHTYTFLRDKRLIVVFNGQNKIGHWEILPTGKLLIEFENEAPLMLENAFVNKAVLVLKKNGDDSQPFILFDRMKIPDGNIVRYFERLEERLVESNGEELEEGQYATIVFIIIFVLAMFILGIRSGNSL